MATNKSSVQGELTETNGSGGGGGDDGGMCEWNTPHSGRLGNLVASEFQSDLTLILGLEKLQIPVHKIFLQSGSRVLNSRIKPSSNELIIDNVDTRVFKLMLQYLYTGDPGATMRDALPLLQLATDYEIKELGDQCATLLKSDITDENVLPLFQGAMEYAHGELIQSTLDYICRKARKILRREEFSNLRLECLVEIIQQDKLRVVDEMAVFDAVYRWGEAECVRQGLDVTDIEELRKLLKKPLLYIRFPLMDSTEFALSVANKDILDLKELTTLLTCFLVPPERRNVLPAGRFSSTPRIYVKPCELTIGRVPVNGPRTLSVLPLSPSETLIINNKNDVTLNSLTIWKSIFDHPTRSILYYNKLCASVTIKSGQATVFHCQNQPLMVVGDFLELKLQPAFRFPSELGCIELNLLLTGRIDYLSESGDRKKGEPLQNCKMVSNYGNFEEPLITGHNYDHGLRFKRKSTELMLTGMDYGLIEKFSFSTGV